MSITTSCKRYAQAVFQLAKEKNSLAEWKLDLNKIAGLAQNLEFLSVIENPKIPFDVKKEVMGKTAAGISSLALNLAYLLIMKTKFRHAGEIAEEYDRLVNEYQGIRSAEIATAIPFDNEYRNKLTRQLETIYNQKISADFKVEPAILGGFIVKIDGTLIDGSIRYKLELLRKNIAGVKK